MKHKGLFLLYYLVLPRRFLLERQQTSKVKTSPSFLFQQRMNKLTFYILKISLATQFLKVGEQRSIQKMVKRFTMHPWMALQCQFQKRHLWRATTMNSHLICTIIPQTKPISTSFNQMVVLLAKTSFSLSQRVVPTGGQLTLKLPISTITLAMIKDVTAFFQKFSLK